MFKHNNEVCYTMFPNADQEKKVFEHELLNDNNFSKHILGSYN